METRSTGFTMVEMMVVIGVVAILALMALPSYQNKFVRDLVGAQPGDIPTEQGLRRGPGLGQTGLAVQPPRHVVGQGSLRGTRVRLGLHLLGQVGDLFDAHECEEPQVADDVRVLDVDPVLVEAERRGHLRIQPNGPLFRLAELHA